MAPQPHMATHRASRGKLISLLSEGLGSYAASELVNRTADLLGYGQELSRAEVVHVLDRLSRNAGLVGVSACFAKCQVALWRDVP